MGHPAIDGPFLIISIAPPEYRQKIVLDVATGWLTQRYLISEIIQHAFHVAFVDFTPSANSAIR